MKYPSPIPGDTDLVMMRVGEVWLKGRNQRAFIDRLKHNLRTTIRAAAGPCIIRGHRGHLFLHLEEGSDLKAALRTAADTPGITSVSPIYRLAPDLDAIEAKCVELATLAWEGRDISFAAKTKRLDKSLPMTGTDLNIRFGGAVARPKYVATAIGSPDRPAARSRGDMHVWVFGEKPVWFGD